MAKLSQIYDFLIIGSGAAGLNTALKLADHGRVALLSKSHLTHSSTAWAQGGIAAVASHHDSFINHIHDTQEAGAGLCHPPWCNKW